MKGLLSVLIILGFCFSAFAADFTVVNDENIKLYLKIYPEFIKIQQNMINQVLSGDVSDPSELEESHKTKVEAFLYRYSISLPDYQQLSEKIMKGMNLIEPRQSGATGAAQSGLANMDEKLSAKEFSVIKKYYSKIKRLMFPAGSKGSEPFKGNRKRVFR